jgi:integrase
VAQINRIESDRKPKGAPALDAEALRVLLGKLQVSILCVETDLVDPITLLAATGLRRSELLALRWTDFDEAAGAIAVSGKIVRLGGQGLRRLESGKTAPLNVWWRYRGSRSPHSRRAAAGRSGASRR